MSENLQEALSLLGVGMITVFFVLAIVVAVGQFLIWLSNRFGTETVINPTNARNTQSQTIKPEILAVLTAAVEAETNGMGRIVNIEKQH